MVQWLRLCTHNAGGPGLMAGQGTWSHMLQRKSKVLHVTTKTQYSQRKKERKTFWKIHHNLKLSTGFEQTFPKKISNKHMKRCPVSMVIRKMQIKITTRYHFTSPRTAIIFLVENIKCWQGCGEIGTLVHCQWECKMVQPLWKIIWQFLKKVKH